jgi:hypothetical protein
MTAVPTAWMTRPAASTHRTGAGAHMTKAAVKVATPASRKRRRPRKVRQPTGRAERWTLLIVRDAFVGIRRSS